MSLGESRRPPAAAVLLFLVLNVAAALWATALLIGDLIDGTGVANEPAQLLAMGATVWLGNNLAFGLRFWPWSRGP
jgi:hypothetical protein